MTRRRRRRLVRLLAVVGVLTQLLVGLMNIGLFPAAFVSAFAGVAGVRLVTRELDDAVLRLGVALVASSVGLVFGVVAGAVMAATALLSTGCFVLSWVMAQELQRQRRAEFSVRHGDWSRRQEELHRRRDAALLRHAEPEDGEDLDWLDDLD